MLLYVLLVPNRAKTFQTTGRTLLNLYSKVLLFASFCVVDVMFQVPIPTSPWHRRQYEIG